MIDEQINRLPFSFNVGVCVNIEEQSTGKPLVLNGGLISFK